jgi:hypothetical protein
VDFSCILRDKKSKSPSSSLYTIVIKPGPGLTRSKYQVPGFMGQPGLTWINPEKLKKIKILIFHMKKSM